GVLELVEAHQERLVADPDRLPPVPVALEDGLAALAAPGEVRAQGGEALLRLPLAAVDDELLGGPVGLVHPQADGARRDPLAVGPALGARVDQPQPGTAVAERGLRRLIGLAVLGLVKQ